MRCWLRICLAGLLAASCKSNDAPGGGVNRSCEGNQTAAWHRSEQTCLVEYATEVGAKTRGLAFAPNGDLFVISEGVIYVLFDADGDGVSASTERTEFARESGLNHGLAFDLAGTFVYASTPTTVFRWSYAPGRREASGSRELVVANIPDGGHSTRSLVFDSGGALHVSIGSAGNVDTDASDLALRSQIRRFALPAVLPSEGLDWASGTKAAEGMRNEVGLWFDSAGRFWSVENGRDILTDDRFGGDIHLDNPAEELNRIDGPGPTHFGYPFCWTELSVPQNGTGRGTVHADLSLPAELLKSEAACADPAQYRPPAYAMQGHWAPLSVTEYTGSLLPAGWKGDLIITSHGSWNREAGQTGRLLAWADLRADGTVASVEPILGEKGPDGRLRQGVWEVRPVDVRQGPDGALYFSDDEGNRVFRLGAR